MKIKNYIKYFAIGVLALSATSCEEFFDINDDPNNPVDVTAGQLLPAIQVTTAFNMGNAMQRATGALVQRYAGIGNQIGRYDTYDFQTADFNNAWARTYAGVLLDLKRIQELSEPNGDNTFIGISQIMMAYNYAQFTDLFGDIPFAQALGEIELLDPDFDQQENIYPAIIQMIDDGIASLQLPDQGVNPGNTDRIYGGDIDQWVRFANTLKLKLQLQKRLADPTGSTNAINQLIADDQLLRNNGDNFSVAYTTDLNNQHPMYAFAFLNRQGDIAVSQRFIDSLVILDDPRIPVYLDNNGQASANDPDSLIYTGFQNGSTATPPLVTVRARLGVFPVGANGEAPERMLTYYQLQFMLAEAAVTLGTTGDARDYLEEGIVGAMGEAGVAQADFDAYLQARLTAFDNATTDDERLSIIMRDKWVALFGNGIDSWTDWRRTGFPAFQLSQTVLSPDGDFPRKMLIPQNELAANPKSPTNDRINIRVWWDVQ
ncbi:MAG: SusD/RagB family nutrient-binding outer membrane lipoprotein [Bacteroidota bacterium]